MTFNIPEDILAFQKRMKTELDFCKELFEHQTIRLLACKYAYYIKNKNFIDDVAYDIAEKSWYIMGMALGVLEEHDTSPCIGFDESHPLAPKGIETANRLMKK